jgi:hypothetical protein
MPEIKHLFNAGRMNKDLDERLIPNGEYRDAFNIQLASTEGSNIGAIQNILGNEEIDNDELLTSDAILVGSIVDNTSNKIYWLVKDVNNSYLFSYENSIITTLIKDVGNTVFKFDESIDEPIITGIACIENYLAFTDNKNEPKLIDLNLFDGSNNTGTDGNTQLNNEDLVESDITVIKQKPTSAPNINFPTYDDFSVGPLFTFDLSEVKIGETFNVVTTSQDVINNVSAGDVIIFTYVDPTTKKYYEAKALFISQTLTSNLTLTLELNYKNVNADTDAVSYVIKKYIEPIYEEKMVRFSYRWKFNNGQYSVMAPFSEVAFYPKEFLDYNLETGFNNQMYNSITSLFLSGIEYNINDIAEIDILYKEANNTNIYIYKTISADGFLGNLIIDKENIYSVLPSNQILRQYDAVPAKAKALEITANRLIFGNYSSGFSLEGYTPGFSEVSLVDRTSNTLRSIKSNREYEFGILFEDSYGRQSPIVSSGFGLKKIPLGDEGKGKAFNLKMAGSPPAGVDRFKFYVKELSKPYYNFIIDKAYDDLDDPTTIWLSVPSYEINKFEAGDYINLKKGANTNLPLNNKNARYKVLDVESSKPSSISDEGVLDNRFFIKILRDNIISEELLSSSGIAGVSSLIEPDDFITVNTEVSGGLYIGAISVNNEKFDYWFKDGKVHVKQMNFPTTNDDLLEGSHIPSDVTCGSTTLLSSDHWHIINSTLFNDSTGKVTVYATPVFGGQDIEVFVCYNTSYAGSGGGPAIFETEVDNDLLDIYYETEESYPISEYDATEGHTLRWFNCFNFGNGLESNRIADDYNAIYLDKQVRVSTTIPGEYKLRNNASGLIWSGLYNSRNSVNNLNQFSTGEPITKDLDPAYGSIQLLHSRDTDVIAFCENKVFRIQADKDSLYNADGSTNVVSSNNVLGQAVPYGGEFGISKNPESFASYGYQAYFADKQRGAVLRLSMDGLTVISNNGMSSYFRNAFKNNNDRIIGSYDIHTRQYILAFKKPEDPLLDLPDDYFDTIAFSESVKGWTTRLSFIPEGGAYLNGNYFTFKKGNIWKHHSIGINNFYGDQRGSSVKFIFNNEPSVVKNFKTITYEGSQGNTTAIDGWKASSIETDLQSGEVIYFKGKEGKWFNNIKGIATTDENLDSKEFSVQGLGKPTSFTIT